MWSMYVDHYLLNEAQISFMSPQCPLHYRYTELHFMYVWRHSLYFMQREELLNCWWIMCNAKARLWIRCISCGWGHCFIFFTLCQLFVGILCNKYDSLTMLFRYKFQPSMFSVLDHQMLVLYAWYVQPLVILRPFWLQCDILGYNGTSCNVCATGYTSQSVIPDGNNCYDYSLITAQTCLGYDEITAVFLFSSM